MTYFYISIFLSKVAGFYYRSPDSKYYGGDSIHLKQEGYSKWAEMIKSNRK